MLSIITENPIPFVLAVIIGLATAWWIWGGLPDADAGADYDGDADATSHTNTDADTNTAVPLAAAGAGAAAAAPVPLKVAEVEAATPKPKIAAAVGDPDDLTKIKGIGPQLSALCLSLGVSRFDQIAKWTASDVAEVDQHLKMKGRIDRDDWIGQAKILAGGGTLAEGGPKIAAAVGKPDDLTKIKGIGPKLNELCQSLGVRRFDQIAKWGKAEIAEVDQYLKIKGRIDRDDWVGQAKKLAKG